MPTFPLPSLKFRTAGFPQYGFKAGRSDRAFPFYASSRRTVCHCPSCSPLPSSDPRSVPGDGARWSSSVRTASAALPQGPSLRSEFFCLGPSTLNRPHPPHSQAHPTFIATSVTPNLQACYRKVAKCLRTGARCTEQFKWTHNGLHVEVPLAPATFRVYPGTMRRFSQDTPPRAY
jgi:hypothetical protein